MGTWRERLANILNKWRGKKTKHQQWLDLREQYIVGHPDNSIPIRGESLETSKPQSVKMSLLNVCNIIGRQMHVDDEFKPPYQSMDKVPQDVLIAIQMMRKRAEYADFIAFALTNETPQGIQELDEEINKNVDRAFTIRRGDVMRKAR